MQGFLPVTAEEVRERGWDAPDLVYVTADAYVDHSSFGHAIISRVLEAEGYRVAMLPQPDWRDASAFTRFGKPKLGFLVSGGVIDSMVSHYTAAKKPRREDAYSPGGKRGCRPDRATIVYCNRIREAYGDVPILIGGIEASLRRFAHYDYWEDRVRASYLIDSGADLLMYGMGERSAVQAVRALEKGESLADSRIPGTCVTGRRAPEGYTKLPSFEESASDVRAYARSVALQYRDYDPVRGGGLCQQHGNRYLIQHPPAMPLTREEMDRVYELPYRRAWHPMYDGMGGVPALSEVKFSLTSCRGCFGACSFCALTFHQGRIVTSRSIESLVREARILTTDPDFKGYIHDVGGPTANFRHPACAGQEKRGACLDRQCLYPTPCKNLNADHGEYVRLLQTLRELPGIKKVFVRSGIRFDYLLGKRSDAFLNELVQHHVSGQLKVAPEHVSPRVLACMGKPDVKVFERFAQKYRAANQKFGLKQYLVPYFMSSHPGSTLEDAILLAEYLKKNRLRPEQVQDFYPTPGTLSTCMYHTGLDPRTMEPVYVARDLKEKAMQRALLQYELPVNRGLVQSALIKAGREDLIGFRRHCLIPPMWAKGKQPPEKSRASGRRRDKTERSRKRTDPSGPSGRGRGRPRSR